MGELDESLLLARRHSVAYVLGSFPITALEHKQQIDLRKKLLDAVEPGVAYNIDDDQWAVLVAVARKPPFVPHVLYQIEPYLRAITDAPCG